MRHNTSIFWVALLGLFLLPQTSHGVSASCPLETQKAYKTNGLSAVTYITENCTRKNINKPDIYFTHFSSWDELKMTTDARLATIPYDEIVWLPKGKLYDPQQGAIVKTIHDPKVYFLVGGKRYWIESAQSFEDLGYKWEWIEDVDQALLDKYPEGNEIRSFDGHPPYTLFKEKGDPKIYRLEPTPGKRTRLRYRHVATEDVFRSLGYRFDRVVELEPDDFYNPKRRFSNELGASIQKPSDAYTINLPHLYKYVPEDLGLSVTLDDALLPSGHSFTDNNIMDVSFTPRALDTYPLTHVTVGRFHPLNLTPEKMQQAYDAVKEYFNEHGYLVAEGGELAYLTYVQNLTEVYNAALDIDAASLSEKESAIHQVLMLNLLTFIDEDVQKNPTAVRTTYPFGDVFLIRWERGADAFGDGAYNSWAYFFGKDVVYYINVQSSDNLEDTTTKGGNHFSNILTSFQEQ